MATLLEQWGLKKGTARAPLPFGPETLVSKCARTGGLILGSEVLVKTRLGGGENSSPARDLAVVQEAGFPGPPKAFLKHTSDCNPSPTIQRSNSEQLIARWLH